MDKKKPGWPAGHTHEHHAKFRRTPLRNQEIDAAIVAFAPNPHARVRLAKAKLAAAIEAGDDAEIWRRQDELNSLLNGRPA